MTGPTYVPDPQLVRELAREAIRIAARQARDSAINGAIMLHHWPEVVDGSYLRYHNLVAAEYDVLAKTMTWLDDSDEDVRAVASALNEIDAIEWYGDSRGDDVVSICRWLRERFAGRIAELEQRDAVATNPAEA